MEDIRSYRIEEETKQRNDEEYGAAPEDEVPFYIPRD
ncbi:MAG: hypothetical protein QOI24_4012 [Acidobacteriota bacterium]|jgi:hypothetical protein|nr:hypothetical protein [Acidobacteriota bacterium]